MRTARFLPAVGEHVILRGQASHDIAPYSQKSPQLSWWGSRTANGGKSTLKMRLWLLTFLWVDCFAKLKGSITLLGLIFLTKSLPGEEAFADKYNSAADLSSNGDLKLQESMCM